MQRTWRLGGIEVSPAPAQDRQSAEQEQTTEYATRSACNVDTVRSSRNATVESGNLLRPHFYSNPNASSSSSRLDELAARWGPQGSVSVNGGGSIPYAGLAPGVGHATTLGTSAGVMRSLSPLQPTVTTGLLPGVGRGFIATREGLLATGQAPVSSASAQPVPGPSRAGLTPPDNLLRKREAKERKAKQKARKAAAAEVAAAALLQPPGAESSNSAQAEASVSSHRPQLPRSQSSQSLRADGVPHHHDTVASTSRPRRREGSRPRTRRAGESRRGSATSREGVASGSSRPVSRAESHGSSHVADVDPEETRPDPGEPPGDTTILPSAPDAEAIAEAAMRRELEAAESILRAQLASQRRHNIWDDVEGVVPSDPDDMPPPFPIGATRPRTPPEPPDITGDADLTPEQRQRREDAERYRVPDSPPPAFRSDPESDGESISIGATAATSAGRSTFARQQSEAAASDAESDTSLPSVFLSPEAQAWENDRAAGLSMEERLARDVQRRVERDSMISLAVSSALASAGTRSGSEPPSASYTEPEIELPTAPENVSPTVSENDLVVEDHAHQEEQLPSPEVRAGDVPETARELALVNSAPVSDSEETEAAIPIVLPDLPVPEDADLPEPGSPAEQPLAATPDEHVQEVQEEVGDAQHQDTPLPPASESVASVAASGPERAEQAQWSPLTPEELASIQAALDTADRLESMRSAASEQSTREHTDNARSAPLPVVQVQPATASSIETASVEPSAPVQPAVRAPQAAPVERERLQAEPVLGPGHRRTQSTSHDPLMHKVRPTRVRRRPASSSESRFRDDATAAANRRSQLWGDKPALQIVPAAFRSREPIVISPDPDQKSDSDEAAVTAEEEQGQDAQAAGEESDSSADVWEAEQEALEQLQTAKTRSAEVIQSSDEDIGRTARRIERVDLDTEVAKAPPPLVLGRSRGGAAYSSSSESDTDDSSIDSDSSLNEVPDGSSRSEPSAPEIDDRLSSKLLVDDANRRFSSENQSVAPLRINKGKQRAADSPAPALPPRPSPVQARAGRFESDSASSHSFAPDADSEDDDYAVDHRRSIRSIRRTSNTYREPVGNRLQGLFEEPLTRSDNVPLGPSALALARASANARADFYSRTRWPERMQSPPASTIAPGRPASMQPPASAVQRAERVTPRPVDEASARRSIFDDIARARRMNASSYSPVAGSQASDTLSSLERLLMAVGGNAAQPPALPPRNGTAAPPTASPLSPEVATSAFLSNRASMVLPPREGRLPTITDATRHFPPSQPTPSWLAYIPAEERDALQQPLQPKRTNASSQEASERASRVSNMISTWEGRASGEHPSRAEPPQSRPLSSSGLPRPPVPPRLSQTISQSPVAERGSPTLPQQRFVAPPSPRTDALNRLVGVTASPNAPRRPLPTLPPRPSAAVAPAPALQVPREAESRPVSASSIGRIFDEYTRARANLDTATFGANGQSASPSTSAAPLPEPQSARLRDFASVLGAAEAASQARARRNGSSDSVDASARHEESDSSRPLTLLAETSSSAPPAVPRSRANGQRRRLLPTPPPLAEYPRRPLPTPPTDGEALQQSPPAPTRPTSDEEEVSERNVSPQAETEVEPVTEAVTRTGAAAAAEAAADGGVARIAARRQASLGITDLDILASRLEAEGDHYEALATLGDFLGPALETRATAEEISELPVAKVELISRRTTKTGKIKQKLEVAGVRVDRCTICLTQFKPDQLGCLFPCLHV